MNDRDRLLELLIERSLEIRPVTLSSGRKSDYYIDCKRVTLSPEGAYLTAKLMLEQIIRRYRPSAANLGSRPHCLIHIRPGHLRQRAGSADRAKRAQKHGTMSYVEGPALEKGSKVAVVEDVVTSEPHY